MLLSLLVDSIMLYELPIVDFEDLTVYVYSRILSKTVPKTLKPVAFLFAF